MGRLRLRALPALLLVNASCQSYVGDYSVAEETEAAISIDRLCEVERDRFIFDVDLESSASEPDLETYYERANPEFVEHLSNLERQLRAGDEHTGVTYVTGAAGVGKSFVMNNSLDLFAEEERCEIDLPELFTELRGRLDFDVEDKPDLQTLDGDIVFNELPSIADLGDFDLESLFRAYDCVVDGKLPPLIVVDGLDELHDETSHTILSSIDRLALGNDDIKSDFFHVVVAGRPGGFSSWLTDPGRSEDNSDLVQRFDLSAPRYMTRGDLEFRARGYLAFSDQLDGLEAEDALEGYLEKFEGAVAAHGFLSYSLGNLAVGNVVIDQTGNALAETEQELKAGLFDDIVVRNAGSHNRPGAGSAFDQQYRELLEDIAVRYTDVSDSGTFVVRSEDTVEVMDDGDVVGEVRVRNVLNRAGLAVLTTVNTASTRYRFEPFWLHGHLIERRNERMVKDYEYMGCER